MHEGLVSNQDRLSAGFLSMLARQLSMDMPRFIRELNERTYRQRVKEQFMSGVRSGVNGTPSFFINGVRFDQPLDADSLTAGLRLALGMAAPPSRYL
jgi:protein-disulfide isomerase